MITVTSTEKKDFSEVAALINHVYGKENNPVKMEDVFTDLLCENNVEHMRIIKADGKPVSVVNYIINEIDINGCIIKAANIGAVCTHEEYRRRGFSNLIVRDCLSKMKEEGVDFLYVSGDIDLYTKNNIHITGRMFNFNMNKDYLSEHKKLINQECEVKACSQEDIHLLSAVYDTETVKYIRDKQRFMDLAERVPGVSVFNNTAKFFLIEEKGEIQGYFICALFPMENGDNKMEIIEYAGKRKLVLEGIIKIMVQLNLASLSGYVSWFDTDMLDVLDEYKINKEACNYPGTMKIINFTQMMQKLKPLLIQGKMHEGIEFCEANQKYIIRSGNKELLIENDKTMHNLFLGNDMEVLKTEHMKGDVMLIDILKLLLPIPVPYPYSLNYI